MPLTVAIPHFVTLLIIKSMLQPEGAMNILLRNLGLIGANTVTAVLYGRNLGESRCHFNQYLGWCSVYTASGDGYSAEYPDQNCMKLPEWTGQVLL